MSKGPTPCKYRCGTMLEWNGAIGAFDEVESGLQHTYDRCLQIKAEKKASNTSTQSKPTQGERQPDLSTKMVTIDPDLILADLKGIRGILDAVIAKLEPKK